MKYLISIGCFIIGWNKHILRECGEASYRQFRKLLSAICIMMILWGTIGYCFADRYINIESVPMKIAVALMFMFIVLCVERVIILTVGKAPVMSVMRVLMAICMAILGSCIFDQIIFRNDIHEAIQEHREDVIQEAVAKRLSIYESDERRITNAMDSLSKVVFDLNEKIQVNPTIPTVDVEVEEVVTGYDEGGSPIKEKITKTTKKIMPNPLSKQLDAHNGQIKMFSGQLETLRQDKKDVEKTTREEVSSRVPGFIEELEATLKVVSQSWASLAFYIILFLFLLFLELFVLTIKAGDSKCDYDLIVEHQLNLKMNLMDKAENSLKTR
ncbi:MAG: DUF4407 domain-containing protein [Bacteroidaceae bacterium]|nr:DUF4407 domain-containing protein [Bacteroidaceae bacterium]